MGFGKAFGIGLGVSLGAGLGMGISNAVFGSAGFGPVFGGNNCFGDYPCYNYNQFSRMDRMLDQAYAQGRFDQARLDRMQLAAMVYGRSAWC